MNIIRLGSITRDKTTGLKGMVTTAFIGLNKQIRNYFFQPRGISPESLTPVAGRWVEPDQLEGCLTVQVDLPIEILGTHVKDQASGFSGVATGLTLHLNGCVHVAVQAKGTIEKTGEPIGIVDLDIRRLTGPAVPKLTATEKAESELRNPSPMELPSPHRR